VRLSGVLPWPANHEVSVKALAGTGWDVVDGDSAFAYMDPDAHAVSGRELPVAPEQRRELEWVSVLRCVHPVKLLEADPGVQLPEEEVVGCPAGADDVQLDEPGVQCG
jgi:hypothetical protein